jgi:hypothetical protein
VLFYAAFFASEDADRRRLRDIIDTTAWERKAIKFCGQERPIPRLTA